MSDTATVTATKEHFIMPNSISSSVSSLGSPRKGHSEFSRPYKQASNFFLTRRFPEALSIVAPLITVPEVEREESHASIDIEQAPIARVEKKWRVKVWSFYLTLINAIADLGLEDGRNAFGKQQWKTIINKAEDGSIWQKVVDIGYGGSEGRVDPEVVVNLANLLLAQSNSQKKNQERLESYLSTPSPSDVRLSGHHELNGKHSDATRGSFHDLETRLQIIELFALHVLPRNCEWEYAQDFVRSNDMLDEERKDAFLQTINDLREADSSEQEQFEDALPQHDGISQNPPISNDIGRTDSNITIKPEPPRIHTKADNIKYHGITVPESEQKETELKFVPPEPAVEPTPPPPSKSLASPQSRQPKAAASKADKSKPQSTVLARSLAVANTIHRIVSNMAIQFSQNPMVLTRFLLFIIAFIAAFGRRDIRERLRRLTGQSWDKIRQTVGMGVKVSYI